MQYHAVVLTSFFFLSSQNPVVKLFTGHCRTEGLLEGQKFVNESDFGAFPIQVQGHAHLHDSLEAACVNIEMEQEVRGGNGRGRGGGGVRERERVSGRERGKGD